MNRDYNFIFRSRPLDSCKYEPYKVILLIASAEGYHHNHPDDVFDPRLSADGVSQSKIVSAALRRAKQPNPQLIFCSTMYRALSTMQLVCPDWYDDVDNIVALDELRPRYGTFKYSKRSNIVQLNHAFKRVSFDYIKHNEDHLWHEHKLESDELLKQRIHEFVTKYLIPQNELIHTMYGTGKCSTFDNIGWNAATPGSRSRSSSPNPSKYTRLFKKRVVVVSHCEFFEYLIHNLMDDVSPQLCKTWKHGDIRKLFVYTKQQLGIASIPYFAPVLSNEFRNNSRRNGIRNRKSRSKSPYNALNPITNTSQQRARSNPFRKDRIATTSKGMILMTNKSFDSHKFTLTTMSAALINTHHKMPSDPGIRFSRSADHALARNRVSPMTGVSKYDVEEEENVSEQSNTDDEEEIKVWNPQMNSNHNGSKYDRFLGMNTHRQRKHIIVITPPRTT
eukprot:524971_1